MIKPVKKYNTVVLPIYCVYLTYKKEEVVWLPMRQLSTKDQNETDINNYRSVYGLQQWAKPIPHS